MPQSRLDYLTDPFPCTTFSIIDTAPLMAIVQSGSSPCIAEQAVEIDEVKALHCC